MCDSSFLKQPLVNSKKQYVHKAQGCPPTSAPRRSEDRRWGWGQHPQDLSRSALGKQLTERAAWEASAALTPTPRSRKDPSSSPNPPLDGGHAHGVPLSKCLQLDKSKTKQGTALTFSKHNPPPKTQKQRCTGQRRLGPWATGTGAHVTLSLTQAALLTGSLIARRGGTEQSGAWALHGRCPAGA